MLLIRWVLLLLLATGGTAAHAQWRRAESPNFVVFSQGPEQRLRQRVLQLEDFHQLMRTITATRAPTSPNKLHIYVVNGNADLRVVLPVSRDIAGYYTASADGIAALVDAQATDAATNQILFHEYAHHFMMQYSAEAYPAWFIEGFAEYFSTARFTPRQIDIGNFSTGRIYSVVAGPWLPIERVIGGTPDGLNREAGAAYYAQAWLMAHWFYSNPERQAMLRRYLAAARQQDALAALQAATAMTPDQFERTLRAYIGRGSIAYRRMQRTPAAAPPLTVTTLPPAANDLMLYAAALQVGLRDEDTTNYLARIRTAAARHAADPFARRVHAHAELLHGDRATALRLLEALQAERPADAELMYLRGRLHLTAAEADAGAEAELREARRWFGEAHRADPNHFQTLYRFAMAQRQGSGSTSENTANVLLLAQQLAPQVVEIRMNAASLLLARGDTDLAAELLRPVIADPHNRGLAAAARRLLDSARAVTTGGAPKPTPAAQPNR